MLCSGASRLVLHEWVESPHFYCAMNSILINGSGSSGNNIIIESNGKKLLVDLGISAREILKSVNYKIDDWSAAICSHR